MARNAIESEFRKSKMADGNHFVKFKKKKVVYWSENPVEIKPLLMSPERDMYRGGGGGVWSQKRHFFILETFGMKHS